MSEHGSAAATVGSVNTTTATNTPRICAFGMPKARANIKRLRTFDAARAVRYGSSPLDATERIPLETASWLTVLLKEPLDFDGNLAKVLGSTLPDLTASATREAEGRVSVAVRAGGQSMVGLYSPRPTDLHLDTRLVGPNFDPGVASFGILPSHLNPFATRKILGEGYPAAWGDKGQLRIASEIVISLLRHHDAAGILLNKAHHCVKPVSRWLTEVQSAAVPMLAWMDWAIIDGPTYATFGMVTAGVLDVRTRIANRDDTDELDKRQRAIFYAAALMVTENRLLQEGETVEVPADYAPGSDPAAKSDAPRDAYTVVKGDDFFTLS